MAQITTLDVRFRNPFYHNQFGLLGGGDDSDTIYTLPDTTTLPETAVIVSGSSVYRVDHPPRRTQRKDGRFTPDQDSKPGSDAEDDAVETDAYAPSEVEKRATPVEGRDKVTAPKIGKKKAAKR
jgi:hypothetical protein